MRQAKALLATALMASTLGLPATPLSAQSTFSLPPGETTPSARPAGPIDPNDPTTTAPRPRPTATSAPEPSASASAAPTPTPTARPAASPVQRPAARTAPLATAAPAPATSAPAAPSGDLTLPGAPTAGPTSNATGSAPFATTLSSAPGAAAEPAVTSAAATSASLPGWWPWAVGMLALLAAIAAALRWRSQRAETALPVEFEPPVVPAPTPEEAPEPTIETGSTVNEPDIVVSKGLTLELEARRLDASLVATTLAYSLRLTNHGSTPLSDLVIAGDMIAAHASLPVEQQIASPDQKFDPRHAATELQPGESIEFRGEFRLPLAAITPIRAGNATYFVPLARLRVEASRDPHEPLILAHTFVIGDLPDQPGGALRPFRLDLGPRTFGRIGQRAIN